MMFLLHLHKKNPHNLPSVLRDSTQDEPFQNRQYDLELNRKQWPHIAWKHHKNSESGINKN